MSSCGLRVGGVLTTLVEVARSRRITQIVLGQSRATRLAGLLRSPPLGPLPS